MTNENFNAETESFSPLCAARASALISEELIGKAAEIV